MQQLRACLQIKQGGKRLAVAAPARQAGYGYAVNAAVAAKAQQGINAAAFKGAVQRITRLEAVLRRGAVCAGGTGVGAVPAFLGARPAFFADDDGNWLIKQFDFGNGFFLCLYQGAAGISKLLGIGLDFFHHQPLECAGVGQHVFEFLLLGAQVGKLLRDFDGFKAGELAQAYFKDVFGLRGAQGKTRHECGFGFVAFANGSNDLIDIEQHDLPPFKDVDALKHFAQAVLAAAGDGALAKGYPLLQHLADGFLHGLAVYAYASQIDGAG